MDRRHRVRHLGAPSYSCLLVNFESSLLTQVQLIIHNNFRLKLKILKCAKSIDGLLLLMSAQALLVLCVETVVLPAAACRLGLKNSV